MKVKRIRKISITAIIILLLLVCGGCGADKLQGVVERDSGEIAITFTVPDGMSVEEVLGSKIGVENSMNITKITSSGTSSGGFGYWYTVDKGGILCRKGDVYRY